MDMSVHLKQCSGPCGEEKLVTEFSLYTKRSGERYPMAFCKVCHSERSRGYRAINMAWLREVRSNPCVDCGVELPPEVMELDHVFGPKAAKFANLAHSRKRLEAEVAKCELRCPNCHAMRHYEAGDLTY